MAWVFLTAMCTAVGIWATHFVAILAYDPGSPTDYDPVLTIASLLIAAMAAMAGFAISSRAAGRWSPPAGPSSAAASPSCISRVCRPSSSPA